MSSHATIMRPARAPISTKPPQLHTNRPHSLTAARDRDLVLVHAHRLLADGAAGELSALIGRAMNISESRVDRILAAECFAARAECATLRSALTSLSLVGKVFHPSRFRMLGKNPFYPRSDFAVLVRCTRGEFYEYQSHYIEAGGSCVHYRPVASVGRACGRVGCTRNLRSRMDRVADQAGRKLRGDIRQPRSVHGAGKS